MRAHDRFVAAAIAMLVAASAALGAPRDVQFRSVDLAAGVLELHNFGSSAEDLSGWRFCSHDENEIRRYSSTTGLNGVSIPAGDSLFVHFNNDASGADEINISTIGGFFASPFDGAGTGDAYGIQIYFPGDGFVTFGDGNEIADHIQWARDGIDNTTADERSDEAENGLVWDDQTEWIATSATTTYIRLRNPTAGGSGTDPNVNDPSDYDALDARPDCQPNGEDDFFDIQDGTSMDSNMDGIPDECQAPATCDGDADQNGAVDSGDISFIIFRLGTTPAPCSEGDVDNSGAVDSADISYVIFRLGTCDPDPCAP